MLGSISKCVSYARGGSSGSNSEEKSTHIALYPFGLATYRRSGNLWTNLESGDDERVVSFYNAADSWLRQLKVVHHDYNFFTTH